MSKASGAVPGAELVLTSLPPNVTADEIREFWSNFSCTRVSLDASCAYLSFATGKDFQNALEVARDDKSPLYMSSSDGGRFRLYCSEVRGRLFTKQPSQGPAPSEAARATKLLVPPPTQSRVALDDMCGGCKRLAGGQVVCGGCRFVIYCDVVCQRLDWKLHRIICQHLSHCENESSDPFCCFACDIPFSTEGDRVPVCLPCCGHIYCKSCVVDAPSGCARAECPDSSSPALPLDEAQALPPVEALTQLISRQEQLRTTPPLEHQRNLVALLQRQRGRLRVQLSRVDEELEQEERVLAELGGELPGYGGGDHCSVSDDVSHDTTADSSLTSDPAASASSPAAKWDQSSLDDDEVILAGRRLKHCRNLSELQLFLKQYLGNSVVLNWRSSRGDTALTTNCAHGRLWFVKAMCGTPGVDVNRKNAYGTTPLMKACFYAVRDVVEYLLTVPGVDLRATDSTGRTALQQIGAHSPEIKAMVFQAQALSAVKKQSK